MNKGTTFRAAVTNGAGAILTDGRNSYKVSDWSPSDRAVYGWHMAHDGVQGAYGKLPDGLAKA